MANLYTFTLPSVDGSRRYARTDIPMIVRAYQFRFGCPPPSDLPVVVESTVREETTFETLVNGEFVSKVERMRATLLQVEWTSGEGSFRYDFCPWCSNMKYQGHVQSCPRQVALGLAPAPEVSE